MGRKPTQNGISRREFARGVALATAGAAALPRALLEKASAAIPPAQEAKMPPLTPAGQAEVDSRIQAIFSRYGDRLSDAQKADVRRLVATLQPQLEKLRAYSIANEDAPATVLKPIVEREKTRPKPASPAKTHKGEA